MAWWKGKVLLEKVENTLSLNAVYLELRDKCKAPFALPSTKRSAEALVLDLSLAEHMVRRYAFSVLKVQAPWLLILLKAQLALKAKFCTV
ncbi:hypothetical protein [Photobacterium leiognathi]|uniref:hypothetical protein n=1 Tax=Photobacterium leiognathi TaxID=553611 RepID=UPI0029822CAD|nr:hypothetical protein [Photobacterium leiognathi]